MLLLLQVMATSTVAFAEADENITKSHTHPQDESVSNISKNIKNASQHKNEKIMKKILKCPWTKCKILFEDSSVVPKLMKMTKCKISLPPNPESLNGDEQMQISIHLEGSSEALFAVTVHLNHIRTHGTLQTNSVNRGSGRGHSSRSQFVSALYIELPPPLTLIYSYTLRAKNNKIEELGAGRRRQRLQKNYKIGHLVNEPQKRLGHFTV